MWSFSGDSEPALLMLHLLCFPPVQHRSLTLRSPSQALLTALLFAGDALGNSSTYPQPGSWHCPYQTRPWWRIMPQRLRKPKTCCLQLSWASGSLSSEWQIHQLPHSLTCLDSVRQPRLSFIAREDVRIKTPHSHLQEHNNGAEVWEDKTQKELLRWCSVTI